MSQQYENYCKKYAYTTQQKIQLKQADDAGLDLSYLCDPRYDSDQMKEIRLCLSQNIDPTPFCHPDIPAEQMKGMRIGLFENNAVYDEKHEAVEKKKLRRIITVTVFVIAVAVIAALGFWKKDMISQMFQNIDLELVSDSISIGESKSKNIDYMDYIKKYDQNCSLALPKDRIEKKGTYRVKYSISNKMKTVDRYLTIKVYDDIAPVLTLSKTDESIEYGSSFNAASYIESATDNEDGDIKNRVKTEGSVDCQKTGNYKVKYYVSDEAGNRTEKELNVSVGEQPKQIVQPQQPQQSSQNSSQQNGNSNSGGSQIQRRSFPSKVTASPKVFSFSSSGDMTQTYSQAVQYAQSQVNAGHANSYNVTPIQGSDGIYTGYRVTFS